jgi:hypothetical protein
VIDDISNRYGISRNQNISLHQYVSGQNVMSSISHLKISCWNIDGLYQRISGLRLCKTEESEFHEMISNKDIFCLTETHCRETDNPSFPGFNVHLNNRPKNKKAWRASGGIAIFIRKAIAKGVSVIKASSSEIVWLKLCKIFFNTPFNIYIAVTYVSPINSSFTCQRDDMFSILEQDVCKYSSMGKCIILGDFNARTAQANDFIINDGVKYLTDFTCEYQKDIYMYRENKDKHAVDTYGGKLLEFCKGSGLRILNGRCLGDTDGQFTCYSPTGAPSLIDYALAHCDIVPKIRIVKVSSLTTISIHCQVSIVLQLPNPVSVSIPSSSVLTYPIKYKWKVEDGLKFQTGACAPEIMSEINKCMLQQYDLNSKGADEIAQDVTTLLYSIASKAKLIKQTNARQQSNKKSKTCKKKKTWYDEDCKVTYQDLKKLAVNVQKEPHDIFLRGMYAKAKKQYKYLLKKKKRAHHASVLNLLNNCESEDPKLFWENFKKLKEMDNYHCKGVISADEWIKHFTKIMGNSNSADDNSFDNKVNALLDNNRDTIFNELNFMITEMEVTKAISSLKVRKAAGMDGIISEMLKSLVGHDTFVRLLCKLCNHVLSSGIYPETWRYNILVPVLKKGDPNIPDNYRGLALGSTLSKLFCVVLNKRLEKFVSNYKIIPENQIGFRKGYRTADHILTLKTLLDKYLNKAGKKVFACFVDFKKAYDTVWRNGLLYKLIQIGMGGNFLEVIRSMYQSVSYSIKCPCGGITQSILSGRGLQQGGVLSPMLFSIYMHDLPDIFLDDKCMPMSLNNCKIGCLMYADDIVLLSESAEGIQYSIDLLQEYCKKWHLTVNLNKTKVIVFNKGGRLYTENIFKYNESTIETVKNYPYLGIIISANGGLHDAQNALKDKGLKAMHSIIKDTTECRPSLALKLFDSLIRPVLNYGCEVWAPSILNGLNESNFITLCDKSGVEKVMLKFAKFYLGVHKNATNVAVRGELGLYPNIITQMKPTVKYLVRLFKMPKESLAYNSLMECLYLNDSNCKNWLTGIKALLVSYDARIANDIGSIVHIKNIEILIFDHFKRMYTEQWKCTLNKGDNSGSRGNKLSTYKEFKENFELETYLLNIKNKQVRSSLTKLRISAHTLKIEMGRYHKPEKIPVERRLCEECNEVENEYHFVMNCSMYTNLRDIFFIDLENTINTYSMTDIDKFNLLMSSHDYNVNNMFSKFVHAAFEIRNQTNCT